MTDILLPISEMNAAVEELAGPRDSRETGWKKKSVERSAYLDVFFAAATSEAAPALVEEIFT